MRILVLAAVVLGGVFGTATATVESIDDEVMEIEIEVEVSGSLESVVAHFTFEEDEPLVLPLLDRGEGTFGLRTELQPKNYFVVFEVVGDADSSSDPVSLVEMGAELGPVSGGATTTMPDDELSDESESLLWLAIALGAASLSLLAFWVLGSRDEEEIDHDDKPADEEEIDHDERPADEEE